MFHFYLIFQLPPVNSHFQCTHLNTKENLEGTPLGQDHYSAHALLGYNHKEPLIPGPRSTVLYRVSDDDKTKRDLSYQPP